MKASKYFLILFFVIFSVDLSMGQNRLDLSDGVIFCNRGALPVNVPCEGQCETEYHYPSGKLLARGECQEGKKTGQWTTFYENGNTKTSGKVVRGYPDGIWTFYYENGKVRSKGSFTRGVFELGSAGSMNFIPVIAKTGEWSLWNREGKLILKSNFANNEFEEEALNGPFVQYHDNGKKAIEGTYKNNMKTGTWTYWHKNGKRQREENYLYKDCNLEDFIWYECPTGTWTYWDEEGKMVKQESYQEGRLVKTVSSDKK